MVMTSMLMGTMLMLKLIVVMVIVVTVVLQSVVRRTMIRATSVIITSMIHMITHISSCNTYCVLRDDINTETDGPERMVGGACILDTPCHDKHPFIIGR